MTWLVTSPSVWPGTLFEMDIAAALLNIGLRGSREKTLLYFKTLDIFFSILYIFIAGHGRPGWTESHHSPVPVHR